MSELPPLPSDTSTRRKLLIAELTARLRSTCADWPDDVFTAMVERLADITMRYDGHRTGIYDRRATDRLIDDLKAALVRNRSRREGGSA